MRLSEKQRTAVEFIAANPEATVQQIIEAAGVSDFGSNGAEFIYRLLSNGAIRLDVAPEVRDAIAE